MNIKTLLSCAGVLFIFPAFTYTNQTLKAKDIQENFVRVNNNLLLDKYEVSNADYNKFMSSLKMSSPVLWKKCLQDTSKWLIELNNKPLVYYYHSDASYGNYPVVTISYDAAVEYCKWLTDQYNADPEKQYKKVLFRLPTKQEWTDAATGGDKNKIYPWNSYTLRDKSGSYLCNFKSIGDQSISFNKSSQTYEVVNELSDKQTILVNTNSFSADAKGLYNMSGNAAEMVAEEGIALGGSFADPGYDVRIQSEKHYDDTSTKIGFRVAMEIINQ